MNWHHDLEMLKEIHQSFQNYWQMRIQFYTSRSSKGVKSKSKGNLKTNLLNVNVLTFSETDGMLTLMLPSMANRPKSPLDYAAKSEL